MTTARSVLFTVVIIDTDFQDEYLTTYAGLEKDGFLYLIREDEISDWDEPTAYYKLAINSIPHYNLKDDWNDMYAEHWLTPTPIDANLIPEIKAAAKIVKERYAR